MKYYLDTEFYEYEKCTGIFKKTKTPTIDLISIGIVSEDEREYYAICKDFDVRAAWKNDWLRENVLKLIYKELHDKENLEARRALYRANVYITQTKFKFTCRNLKKLVNRFGKSKEEIASEIKQFVSIKTGYSNFSDKSSSNVLNWVVKNDTVLEEIERLGIKTVFEGEPQFYAYYADYDWVVFCWLFGRMIDLPEGFPKYCYDLKQLLNEKASNFTRSDFFTAFDFANKGLSELTQDEKIEHLKLHVAYPTQENEHNALEDAKWNMKLHKFLNNLA